MTSAAASHAFARLVAAVPESGDRDHVVNIVEDCRRVRALIDAVEVRCTARLRGLAAEGSSESPESVLGRCGKRSSKEAAKAKGREQVAATMPGFADALGAGDVSIGHLDAIADATRRLEPEVREEFISHQADLLAAAGRQTVDAFDTGCRDLAQLLTRLHDADAEIDELERQRKLSRIRRSVDRDTGMRRTIIELDPLRDEILHRVLRAHFLRIRHRDRNAGNELAELEIDALTALVDAATDTDETGQRATAGGRTGLPAVPEIGVFIDYNTLLGAASEHGICHTYDGVPVPVDTVRRLCCEAKILPYVLASTAKSSTTDAKGVRPTGPNDADYAACTEPAPTRTARSVSSCAASTTSPSGSAITAAATSKICFRYASGIITSSTKATGP